MTEMSTIESDVLLAVLFINPSFVVVLKIESISIVDSLGTDICIEVKRLLDSSKLVGNEDMDIYILILEVGVGMILIEALANISYVSTKGPAEGKKKENTKYKSS